MEARAKLEEDIRDAIQGYAVDNGEDHFEINVIVSIIEDSGTLDIDTSIVFEDH